MKDTISQKITLLFIFLLVMPSLSIAALYDRGGGLIYDDVKDITWLQNGNYAEASGYDSDGLMGWDQHKVWVNNLSFGGYNDWRLPTVGRNPVQGPNQTVGELGHMFYNNMGGTAGNEISGDVSFIDARTGATVYFIDVQGSNYFYNEESSTYPTHAWAQRFNDGNQHIHPKGTYRYSWPVRDGDVNANHDPDGDGVFAAVDNCVNDANPDQADADGDNLGNACDDDYSPIVNSGSAMVDNASWSTITLTNSFQSMIVVATAEYSAATPPVSTRIRNAGGNQFDVKLQRLDGQTGSVVATIHYIAVEEGVYSIATHGITMEAVKYTSTVTDDNNSWVGELRSYQTSYTNPVVIGQVQTANDTGFSEFWSRGATRTDIPSASTLWVGKHVAEDPNATRVDETVGYVVIESGSGMVDGMNYLAGVGADTVEGIDNGSFNYLTGQTGTLAGIAACSTAMDGPDGGWAVLTATPLVDTLTLAIDEDQLNDTERSHTTEQVAYWLLY